MTTLNKSLAMEKVLEEWKLANATPIFKMHNKLLSVNHHPLSLTSAVSKLTETCHLG